MGDLLHWEEGKRAKGSGLVKLYNMRQILNIQEKTKQMSPHASILGWYPRLPMGDNPTNVRFSPSISYQIRKFLFKKGQRGRELANEAEVLTQKCQIWNAYVCLCTCVYAHMCVDQGS